MTVVYKYKIPVIMAKNGEIDRWNSDDEALRR